MSIVGNLWKVWGRRLSENACFNRMFLPALNMVMLAADIDEKMKLPAIPEDQMLLI